MEIWQLEFIKEISKKFIFIEDEDEVYDIMKHAFIKLLPGIPFIIAKVIPNQFRFKLKIFYGFEKYIDTVQKLIGKNPLDIEYPFSSTTDDILAIFNNRQVYYYENGFYEITNGTFNKAVCYSIEKIVGLKNIAAIGIAANNIFYASTTFYILKGHNLNNNRLNETTQLIIEIISNQAATAIQNIRKRDILIKKDKELSEGKQRFEALLNNLTDIIWEADGEGNNLRDLKNSFENFFGRNANEFIRNPAQWLDHVYPDDKNIAQQSFTEFEKNGFSESEYRVLNKAGDLRWLLDRKSIIFDEFNRPLFMGGISTDVTNRKLTELELQRTTEQLIESNQTKDTLFSILAHDLKSPFNSLMGYTDLLVENYNEISNYEKLEIICMLNKTVHNTFDLLINLLDWSRIQGGKIQIKKSEFQLFGLIQESISPYLEVADSKDLKIEYIIPDTIKAFADPYTFQTIIRNLFMNAIKYSYKGGKIKFMATGSNHKVYISLTDEGIGMTDDTLKDLFSISHTKSHVGTQKERGTGLGLIICKEFAEKNSGTLVIKSSPGKGTRVTLVLPSA